MEQIIYVKRFIKTEDDLPVKGKYIVISKKGEIERDLEYHPVEINNRGNAPYWMKYVDSYFQPTTLAELINDNYVPKEFVEWYGRFVTEVHGQYGLMELPKEAMMAKTHDELLQYWKEQIRDK